MASSTGFQVLAARLPRPVWIIDGDKPGYMVSMCEILLRISTGVAEVFKWYPPKLVKFYIIDKIWEVHNNYFGVLTNCRVVMVELTITQALFDNVHLAFAFDRGVAL